MNPIEISNKTRILEITAVILTAIGKFVFLNYLEWRLPFILAAMIGWLIYIAYRYKTNPDILSYWGFRTDNFKPVMKKVIPFGLFALAVMIGIGLYLDTIHLTWHIIPILILYPLWGVIQHFLLIALTAGNLRDMAGDKMNKGLIIFVCALLFAAVHYPFPWLVAGTFFLSLFYGWIYLKEKNLYVLGLFHGWLGALFYYFVLERDPYVEIFGKFM